MKKNNENLTAFIVMIIGIVSTAMIFLPALSFPDSDSTFLGYEVVFGTEFINLGSFASGQIVWSFLGIVAYLSALIASLIVVFSKKGIMISSALFAIGATLLFTLPTYTKTTITIMNTVTEIQIDWVISYGLIISASLATLGLIVCLYKIIYKK